MTGVPAGDCGDFLPGTQLWTKRIGSDLAGALTSGGITFLDHGLDGALIQPNPGTLMLLAKLSSLVPDDPTVDSTSEQLAHAATVSLDVTPRSYMLRA